MTPDEIEPIVLNYLREHLVRGGEVESDTQLLSSGLLDSMALNHLITFVEDKFSLAIPDDDLGPDTFRSPRALAELLSKLQRAR